MVAAAVAWARVNSASAGAPRMLQASIQVDL